MEIKPSAAPNAFIVAGGYRSLGRALRTSVRVEVKNREGGRCKICGKPGTEIDHIDGSSADPDNLQLLCADCHHTKTAENLVPASTEQRALLKALFMTRVAPEIPRLLAEDEVTWQTSWSGLRSSRKARFVDSLKTAGIDLSGLKTRAQMIAARETQVPMPSPRPQEYDEADYGSDFLGDAIERSARKPGAVRLPNA